MNEQYSEYDVLEALRSLFFNKQISISTGAAVSDIRYAIAWNLNETQGQKGIRERFYSNHSNKWVLRKLRILRKQGNAIDRKFRWYLSDAEVVAQKLIGNLK